MLNITGLNRFFFVRDFHDMRCKYDKVLSIIHQQIHEGYFPFSGQPAIIDVVPGTHASGSFPAYLVVNCIECLIVIQYCRFFFPTHHIIIYFYFQYNFQQLTFSLPYL